MSWIHKQGIYENHVLICIADTLLSINFSIIASEGSDKRTEQATLLPNTMGIIEKLQASMSTNHSLDTTRTNSKLTHLQKSNSTAWSSATLAASTAPRSTMSSMSTESTSSTVPWTRPHRASPSTPQEVTGNRQPGTHPMSRDGGDGFFPFPCLNASVDSV